MRSESTAIRVDVEVERKDAFLAAPNRSMLGGRIFPTPRSRLWRRIFPSYCITTYPSVLLFFFFTKIARLILSWECGESPVACISDEFTNPRQALLDSLTVRDVQQHISASAEERHDPPE